MNQSGSYSVSKKGQGAGDNQYYLLPDSMKNGPTVMPKSITRTGSDVNTAERQPFLDRRSLEPVRLTPAWEDNNLSDDELNFKNLTMEQANLELNPPKDKYKMVFIILVLHGIGVLMPWNMFINARSYFVDYKLSKEYTHQDESPYAAYFPSYVGFAAQIPNLIFTWLNIFVRFGGRLTLRIVWCIIIEIIMIIITIVMAMVDTTNCPGAFFWITMVTVVIINMASGVYQNTIFGLGARLPFQYSGAIILGANISGTFVSVIELLTIFWAPSKRTAAIYYFIMALFILLVCFDTYFALPLNRFFRYNKYIYEKVEVTINRENAGVDPRVQYCTILKKASKQLINVFLVFFVTLTIFPVMHSGIKKSDENFIVPDKFYEGVMCFLTFNVTAMLGSLTSNWIRWPSPKYLVIPVVLRVLFIPFFFFCNYQPDKIGRKLPVLIENDWAYWAAGVLMGFTSGYFSSVAMMYTSGSVEPRQGPIAGMFGGAFIVTGIVAGVTFSMVFSWLAKNVSI